MELPIDEILALTDHSQIHISATRSSTDMLAISPDGIIFSTWSMKSTIFVFFKALSINGNSLEGIEFITFTASLEVMMLNSFSIPASKKVSPLEIS